MNIERILAPNAGPMTGPGTNSWVVRSGDESVLIDPGPVIESHLDAIRQALHATTVRAVLITHTHPDHAPAANPLAAEFGVPAIGNRPGPEFSPDRRIADGESVGFGDLQAVCVETPGHTPDSVSYRIRDALFVGDHIMGGSTVMVEDMGDYLNSLRKLQSIGLDALYPGHGPVIDAPEVVIADYVAHRLEREEQILSVLAGGAGSVGEIVSDIYRDVDPALHPAAAVSVAAHLAKLRGDGVVEIAAEPSWDSEVSLR